MVDDRINQATWNLVDSLYNTSQTIASSLFAAQDRNMKFAQSLLLMGVEVVESQTEASRQLMDQWRQQLPKQQATFQQALNAALDVYMDFLRLPFAFSQGLVSATGTAVQREIQVAEKAVWQTIETARTLAQEELEQAQLWTFEHPLQEAESQRPVLIRVNGPGIVHAGVNREGKWIRIYDVPLREASPGVWEAYLLDSEVNEFTFIWHDLDGSGQVHWEGKNYSLPRRPLAQEMFNGQGKSA